MSGPATCTYALIDPVGAKAGMDQYDMTLAKGLSANGMHGILLSNFNSCDDGTDCDPTFHNLGKRGIRSATSTLSGYLRALHRAKVKKAKWIVVHIFTAGPADAVLLTLARLMGFRICGIVHDIESLDEFSPGGIRKRVIRRLLDRRIVHNRFSFDELVRLGMIQAGDPHTHIIPHVHFISLFREKTGPPPHKKDMEGRLEAIHPALKKAVLSGKPILLFFGQIKKPKGLDLLLQAFRDIVSESVLVIAGKTRDEPWHRYAGMIEEFGMEGKVIPVIRHITDQERDLLFSVSRAVILPYTRIYQSGVLLMAMSFPMAVVASDLPPNRDTLIDGENGLVFNTGDSADLGRQLKRILSEENLAGKLRQNALETMKTKHDPDTIGKAFAAILAS